MSLWRRQCDIRRNGNLILYYGNIIGYVLNDTLRADIIFKKEEVIQWALEHKLHVMWQSGLFEKLGTDSKDMHTESPVKQIDCCIYQLKEDCDPVLRFLSYDDLIKKGKQIEFRNYKKVYDGMLPAQSLDEICEYFDQQVDGYEGRDLMVSDIIEVKGNENAMYYYIDKGCYRQLRPVSE
ncbi:MAG: hypothetical protein KHW81_16065 [[Clostridium] innocuum]|nr:hypothetical protein [[Clostridium] innocuum]MBS5685888.1 hypothetical protein [[Clostridium] innocuum]